MKIIRAYQLGLVNPKDAKEYLCPNCQDLLDYSDVKRLYSTDLIPAGHTCFECGVSVENILPYREVQFGLMQNFTVTLYANGTTDKHSVYGFYWCLGGGDILCDKCARENPEWVFEEEWDVAEPLVDTADVDPGMLCDHCGKDVSAYV